MCSACGRPAPDGSAGNVCGDCWPRACEALRASLGKRESDIRLLGALLYVQAGLLAVFALGIVATGLMSPLSWLGGLCVTGVAYGFGWVGRGLRAFDARVGPSADVLFAAMTLRPFGGTLLGAWAWHVLHGREARMIFSPQYLTVRAVTGHVRAPSLRGVIIGALMVTVWVVAMLLSPAVP